jgi:hypothetical protein
MKILESLLCAGIENCTIIIKNFTVCATEVCNNGFGGVIVLVMISLFVQDNAFAVDVWKNK